MRFFEAIALGRMLLTDYLPQQDQYAVVGMHYKSYKDWADLDRLVEYYLKHDDEREKIAKQGSDHIRENHTYEHRLVQILKDTIWKKS